MEVCVLGLLFLVNGKTRLIACGLGAVGLGFCTGFLEVEAHTNICLLGFVVYDRHSTHVSFLV